MRARSTDFFSVFGRIKKSVFKSVVMLKMAEITCERMILTAAQKIPCIQCLLMFVWLLRFTHRKDVPFAMYWEVTNRKVGLTICMS